MKNRQWTYGRWVVAKDAAAFANELDSLPVTTDAPKILHDMASALCASPDAAQCAPLQAILDRILCVGVDVNTPGKSWSLLAEAVRAGNLETIKKLLAHGANPTPPQPAMSPLLLAIYSHDLTMFTCMLPHADLERKNKEGDTALLAALKRSAPPCFIATLMDKGADINAADDAGNTALHAVAQTLSDASTSWIMTEGLARLVLFGEAGVDPCIKNQQGKSAFDLLENLASAQAPLLLDPLRKANVRYQATRLQQITPGGQAGTSRRTL